MFFNGSQIGAPEGLGFDLIPLKNDRNKGKIATNLLVIKSFILGFFGGLLKYLAICLVVT